MCIVLIQMCSYQLIIFFLNHAPFICAFCIFPLPLLLFPFQIYTPYISILSTLFLTSIFILTNPFIKLHPVSKSKNKIMPQTQHIRWADYRRPDCITPTNLAQVPSSHFNWAHWRYMADPQGMQGYWNAKRGQWAWGDARRRRGRAKCVLGILSRSVGWNDW